MTETMKHFFTLMALLLTSVTFGQETCNNVFDYNDNNTIDIEDFLAILGLFADVDLDDDGTWDSLDNCLDLSACNYASELNEPCTYLPPGDCDCNGNVLDECGVCGGTGLAPGTCDCNGTLIDVIGECGGDCWVDEDADGICDDVDECVGEYDACDVCNGPGAIYECGCANIPDGGCDCYGNVMDAIGACGGTCSADEDADGVCDDVDDCVGEFDVCGVCNGPGEVYECGCGDVPEGECDCEGNVLDALGDCGGECLADEDADGVCDDVDDCVGEFDECGVCNGDGAVYECGCNDIPEGDCDCDGNVFDECGVCNGPGPTEIVIEDIITYYDSVYLPFDDAWYVYPVDADTTFGFTCAPLFSQCGDPVSYQGYDYATVQIGDQCWFAENLRSENYENGDAIPAGLSDSEWDYRSSGAVAVYGEGSSDCYDYSPDGDACDEAWSLNEYGRLYNWYAVDDARGLCPSGWHVPTDEEWMTMEMALGMSEAEVNIAGYRGTEQCTQMKTTYGWSGGGNGTNSSGFSGLPGGRRGGGDEGGSFYGAGHFGYWWGSSFNGYSGTHRALDYNFEGVIRGGGAYPQSGFSVRCIQDTPEVLGCIDPSACNYDELANTDDGSCEYESCAPSFEACGDPVSYQGYNYATVQIGGQCWFAENLRNENYENGEPIPSAVRYGESAGCMVDYATWSIVQCDTSDFDAAYGRLYNWNDIVDERQICPNGWHVPSDFEWATLEQHLGMVECSASVSGWRGTDQGTLLKATYDWGVDGNGTNVSGFTALPGGVFNPYDYFFQFQGSRAIWWTSTWSDDKAWIRRLDASRDDVGRWEYGQENLLSVRCVLGQEVPGCTDVGSCNYNPLATTSDNSCLYDETCVESIDDCGGPLSYQGYNYSTVQIGNDCWFAENLRSSQYRNGDLIPSNLDSDQWENTIDGAVAVYGGTASDCYDECYASACNSSWSLSNYGRLYNWFAVEDPRGLCPSGWHVPTPNEWSGLTNFLEASDDITAQLKSAEGWCEPRTNGSNTSGFSALPSGYRTINGIYGDAGWNGIWWGLSGCESPFYMGIGSDLFNSSTNVDPRRGHSIRCIQDTE